MEVTLLERQICIIHKKSYRYFEKVKNVILNVKYKVYQKKRMTFLSKILSSRLASGGL